MQYYTDYPFGYLGDIPGKKGAIRVITPISYDGDKYVTIEVDGHRDSIKAGYIYTMPGRVGEVPTANPNTFPLNTAPWA